MPAPGTPAVPHPTTACPTLTDGLVRRRRPCFSRQSGEDQETQQSRPDFLLVPAYPPLAARERHEAYTCRLSCQQARGQEEERASWLFAAKGWADKQTSRQHLPQGAPSVASADLVCFPCVLES